MVRRGLCWWGWEKGTFWFLVRVTNRERRITKYEQVHGRTILDFEGIVPLFADDDLDTALSLR